MKIVFFVKEGLDTFINDIIDSLSIEFETKKVTIKTNKEMNLIEKWMNWADICWFEWCDELILYGSKLAIAKERKIICRLHSYEAFTNYPVQVYWNNVDKLIFVAEHLQKYVIDSCKINKEKTIVIPCGVNMDKWTFQERSPGYAIAYAGYINYKKGPMLLLHAFKAIYDRDDRYKLYIAGRYQDPRYLLYFKQMTKELGLENNLFFEGWQGDLEKWLEDKNYILCSSLLESQNMSVMQAMAKGIKPVIHNFAGANLIYPKKYLWNTIDEAVEMITEESYDSGEYSEFINTYYSLSIQLEKIKAMLADVQTADKKNEGFSYKDYWNQRLTSNFNIQGVGYLGLGEIYNKLLYQNRIDILDGILSKVYNDVSTIKVLELGPGIGIFTQYFHEKGVKEYFAIDIVEKAVVELSSKYEGFHFKQGDISDCLIFEGKYQLIFAADVLLHITNEENYKKAIANISGHLDDNGICVLLDPISVMNAKSGSPHVVIRSKEYVEEILGDNELELIDILPVANFMNYPFDRDALGTRGNSALLAFNLIRSLFSNTSISNGEKQLIGEYLLYREKQLLCSTSSGLSEKLLIVQKKGKEQISNFSIKDLFHIDMINDKLQALDQILIQNNFAHQDLFLEINKLVNHLDEREELHNDTTH